MSSLTQTRSQCNKTEVQPTAFFLPIDEVLYNLDSFLAQDVIAPQKSPVQWPFSSSIELVKMIAFSRLDKANIVEVYVGFCIWNSGGTLSCSGLVGAFKFLGVF